MSCLSILDGKAFVVCANPVFVIGSTELRVDELLTFEVFEDDAGYLSKLVGTIREFALGDDPFWAEVTSLTPCVSTHQGLSMLRNKPTLRALLTIKNHAQPTGTIN